MTQGAPETCPNEKRPTRTRPMETSAQTERRKTTRIAMNVRAVEVNRSSIFVAKNLSLDGGCFETNDVAAVGARLELELCLPGGQPLRVRAVVRDRVRDDVRVAFESLDRKARVRLAECLF